MIILGIETSCDETAAAILKQDQGKITVLSNIIASSADIQAKYGGIIPEQAAREQIKSIIPVLEESLNQAKITKEDINAIAITYGPGLIGSLLVGVETAKTLATIWQKPLIPVNHLMGHFYANWISATPIFPCIGLLVSGGHTDLVLFRNHGKYEHLGGTMDDAAGECFDKCARILGLKYPGGPEISNLAEKGDPSIYKLPSPMISSKNFNFSFSGLKTATANLVKEIGTLDEKAKMNIAASIEEAIINVLVKKTVTAAQTFNVGQIIVAGGVAANQKLRNTLQKKSQVMSRACIFIPEPIYCTDNAAMIAAAAFFQKRTINPLSLQANPNLSL